MWSSSSSDDDDSLEIAPPVRPRETKKQPGGPRLSTDRRTGKPTVLLDLVASPPKTSNKRPWNPADSSSDDELLERARALARPKQSTQSSSSTVTQKPDTKVAAKLQRQREKQTLQLQKQQEKQALQLQKQQTKLEQQRQREQIKLQKHHHRVQAAQRQGKYASQEIAVLLEPSLYHHATWKVATEMESYRVHEYRSGLGRSLIQWKRCDYDKGGADAALEEQGEHIPTLVIVFDVAHDLLDLLKDESLLDAFLREIHVGYRAAWPGSKEPRIYFLVYQLMETLDRLWIRKSPHDPDPLHVEDVHDSLSYLLIQHQIECLQCSTLDAMTHEIAKMTRLLSEAPYVPCNHQRACLKFIPAECSDDDPSWVKAHDTWRRQIQVLPQMGEAAARTLIRTYPTGRSLWLAYQQSDDDEAERRLLVSTSLGSRTLSKKSMWMYQIMTSTDPNELLR